MNEFSQIDNRGIYENILFLNSYESKSADPNRIFFSYRLFIVNVKL